MNSKIRTDILTKGLGTTLAGEKGTEMIENYLKNGTLTIPQKQRNSNKFSINQLYSVYVNSQYIP